MYIRYCYITDKILNILYSNLNFFTRQQQATYDYQLIFHLLYFKADSNFFQHFHPHYYNQISSNFHFSQKLYYFPLLNIFFSFQSIFQLLINFLLNLCFYFRQSSINFNYRHLTLKI